MPVTAVKGSVLQNIEANPDIYESDDLTGVRIKRVLGVHYKDRASFTARGRRDSEIYNSLSPAVVIVITPTGLGSGSYLGGDRILTNWHVVKGFQNVGLLFKPRLEGAKPSENSLVVARVVKIDPQLDLALIQMQVAPESVRGMTLAAESDIQIGADVHAIGHPTGEAWTYTKGIISQYRRDYEWKTAEGVHKANVIQTQTPINPGNSGGPLITDDGKLVGVNSFKATGEALNFAVAIGDVQKFLSGGITPSTKKASPCQTKQLYDGRDSQNIARLVQYDTNCDGKPDYSFVTPDDKSKPIFAHIDSNFDGKTDISVEDRNRNGVWTISFHDVDFDGKIDLVGYHADGKLKPTRFEKYVANFKY